MVLSKIFRKIKSFFRRPKSLLSSRLRNILKRDLNEEALEELERTLFEADLGVVAVEALMNEVREQIKGQGKVDRKVLLAEMKKKLVSILSGIPRELEKRSDGPTAVLIVGVNGNGKTTTVAKLARHFMDQGKSVILGAGDTFRAAAIEQLDKWAKKLGVDIVKTQPKGDPSSVAFDTLSASVSRKLDYAFIDTAGRLHTKTDLMKELEKIRRVCGKVIPSAPHETLLVLDATIGQNAIDQAKTFNQFTPITGIVLTKFDGSAKGGIIIALQNELRIPVKFIGVGETEKDLEVFDPEAFATSLLG